MSGAVETLRAPRFAAGLESHGDRVALIAADDATVTYRDLARRADAAAAAMPATRTLVALAASNTVDFVASYLGALRGGHAAILLAGLDAPAAQRIVEAYRPWRPGNDAGPGHNLDPALAVLLSTSGTTGSPKLVRLSAANVDANAASIVDYLGIGPDERAITSLPCHYSYGLSVLNSHLLAGAGVILTDASVSTPAFRDALAAHRATSLAGVPYTYELLESSGFRDRRHPDLRTLTQAGGRLPPALVATYADWAAANDVRFFVMYGQTEATARMAYLPPDRARDASDCIGVAIPGGRFDLVDVDDPAVTVADGPGELVYAGPNVMMGYAEAPADLGLPAGPERLFTGDIAERRADGLFRIVGRKSRFAKPFGLRIGLDDIERLLRDDGIEAAVAGNDALIAVAYRGDRPAGAIATRLVEAFGLPPALFEVDAVPALPRLATGKLDYAAILAAATARREAAAGHQAGFLHIYRDLLARPEAGPDDSFVDLGGDSLSYVAVATAIDRRLGALPDDWAELSIAELDARAAGGPVAARSGWKRVETEVVLRAMAVIAVVINHASSIVVGGGASVLLLLVGYNVARFQRARIARGEAWAMVGNLLTRIILPYYAILLIYLAVKREVDVPALFLVANFAGRFHTLMEPYWFLEVLLQVMAILALILWVPAFRRAATERPWRFGLGLLAAALAAKALAAVAIPHARLAERTPDTVFYLVAMGWCLYFARQPGRRLTMLALAVVLAGLEVGGPAVQTWWTGMPWPANASHDAWLIGATVALLWLPRISLPRWLQRTATAIAAASFYIYLVHVVPVHVIVHVLHINVLPFTVAVAVGLGMLAERLAHRGRRLFGPAVRDDV